MNWDIMTDAIKKIISDEVGVPFYWNNEAVPFVSGPCLYGSISNMKMYGRDQRHSVYNSDLDTIERHTHGQRSFTITIRCETEDERASRNSLKYISDVVAVLGKESVRDAFVTNGMGILKVSQTTEYTIPVDERMMSIAMVDVDVSAGDMALDKPIDFFETFELSQA